MKKALLCFIGIVLLLSGCCAPTKSHNKFKIKEYQAFSEIHDAAEKEAYIRNGNLDFAMVDEFYVFPHLKAISYEECNCVIYVYALNNSNKQITVNSASLCTKDGTLLFCVEDINESITLLQYTENMYYGYLRATTFGYDDSWYYSGNELVLTFEMTVENGEKSVQKSFCYDITLVGYMGATMPT